ncbi:MAG: GHKL domain-containing protein [Rhizobiales bacterium]|nr:GHKL domain-containing protein [Hyphomicrobiales bacterium]
MTFNSLALRLLVSSVLWSILALVVAGVLLSGLYQQSVERGFDQRLNVYLKILVAAQAEAEDPMRMEAPTLTEPNFDLVLSGWYWQVTKQSGGVVAASRSLFAEALPPINMESLKPNEDGIASFYAIGPAGNTLRLVARDISMEGSEPVIIVVAGNASDIQQNVSQFRQRVFLTLTALGVLLAISTLVQVKWGLRPLSLIARGLNDIREGRSHDLQGTFPAEIEPLVVELNALIAFNKKVVERARTHVGNLAHALKTPISVLQNEAADFHTPLSEKVIEQTGAMQRQVNYHLDRAQIIARSGVLSAVHPVKPVIEGLGRAMSKIYRERNIRITIAVDNDLRFSGERQDLEQLLGNLIDNACKWAKSAVYVSGKTEGASIILEIEDDGPGLSMAQQKIAMKRGERLDEKTPGSGLGLSIVRDLVDAYDGNFAMSRSKFGGLKATLAFPVTVT